MHRRQTEAGTFVVTSGRLYRLSLVKREVELAIDFWNSVVPFSVVWQRRIAALNSLNYADNGLLELLPDGCAALKHRRNFFDSVFPNSLSSNRAFNSRTAVITSTDHVYLQYLSLGCKLYFRGADGLADGFRDGVLGNLV